MTFNAVQLGFAAIACIALFSPASSSPVHGHSGSLRRMRPALLTMNSLAHRNESEPHNEKTQGQDVGPAEGPPAETKQTEETSASSQEELPDDDDATTEDHAATTEHHGEEHEHSGSPGKGGGNMVPRSHVHGEDTEHKKQWTYAAPDAWGEGFPLCNGGAQSPVNLVTTAAVPGEAGDSIEKRISYVPLHERKIHDNGHNVQVNGEFGTLELPDGMYQVKQFHFHFPSEHEVDGKLAAGEIHIVHQKEGSEGTNDLAAVSILLQDEGKLGGKGSAEHDKEISFLDNLGFGNRLPKVDEDINIKGAVDLNAFSKQFTGPFFHYKGSLTTPPCSETVHWYVLQEPAPVTPEMVETFKALFPSPSNNRPVRPLNNRKVMLSNAEVPEEFARVEGSEVESPEKSKEAPQLGGPKSAALQAYGGCATLLAVTYWHLLA